jgi:Leucine-rich repeat (LRR) protein
MGLENLEELSVHGNQLTKINTHMFLHLKRLKILTLSSNQITEMEMVKRISGLREFSIIRFT